MKVQLNKEAIDLILAASQHTDRNTAGKGVFINAHILVELKENGLLSVSAVGDGRFHSGLCRIEGSFEAGVAAIKADKFSSLLKCLPQGDKATLTVNDNAALLTCGRSRYKLAVCSPDSFPRMPKMESINAEIEIPSSMLQQGLERVIKSAAINDARSFLEGVCFEVHPEKLVFVATDGHRLSFESFARHNPVNDVSRVLIPRQRVLDLLNMLRKTDEPVRIRFNDKAARAYSTSLQWIFQFSLIDARFPDYERVIPNSAAMPSLKFDRDEFISALERISHIVNKGLNPSCIIKSAGDEILISATGELEDSGEEVVSSQFNSGDVTSSFNIGYMLDALKKLDDDVVDLRMDSGKPCYMTGSKSESAFHVVMPVRM